MPAIGQISLTDGQATPATHVFNPISSNPPIYKRNGVGAALIAEETLNIDLKRATANSPVNRPVLVLEIPVLEQSTGSTPSGYTAPPKVAYVERVKIEFFHHQRSLESSRKDLRVITAKLLADPAVIALIEKLEKPY